MIPNSLKSRLLLLSLLVIVLDQWTKWLVETRLPRYVVKSVIPGVLNLTHVKNTGVAFGFLAGAGKQGGAWLLVGLGIAALLLVGLYFWRTPNQHRLLLTALALVLGGAVGNLIDRINAGAVTDFIDVFYASHHWHTFNVADSAISIGIALIAWDSLRPRREPEAASSVDSSQSSPT